MSEWDPGRSPLIISGGKYDGVPVKADMVAIARPILADPYWPKKYQEGREKEILKCIYCNKCREAEGAFEEVTCFQWNRKDGSISPPNP